MEEQIKTSKWLWLLTGILLGWAGVIAFYSQAFPLTSFFGQKELMPIYLKVDFGDSGHPVFEDKALTIETGTTPKEAVEQVFPVKASKVCCSLRDVAEIGGIAVDEKKGYWWICLLNGSKNVAPSTYRIKHNDKIEWKYIKA